MVIACGRVGFDSGIVITGGKVGFDSGTVIPLVYVIAGPTTNPLRHLRVPYLLVRIDSEVHVQ